MTMRYINRHYLCIYLSIYLFFKNTKQSKLAGNEDPHPELDQHQNLISSRGSSLTQPNESGARFTKHHTTIIRQSYDDDRSYDKSYD